MLNQTFHDVDAYLSKLSEDSDGKMHSGCTAVTAFLRLEDGDGKQSFVPPSFNPIDAALVHAPSPDGVEQNSDQENVDPETSKMSGAGRIKHAFKALSERRSPTPESQSSDGKEETWTPSADIHVRRVLYCANAGDARGVLCRGGNAVRLTYDHKGSDKQEAKRIVDAGGFVMSGRVNGVLAVTRALGDSAMKEYVVGAPYTTETELSEEDEFLILACDGVCCLVSICYDGTNCRRTTYDVSYGTSLTTRRPWTLCARSRTLERQQKTCSTTHTRTTRRTTSQSSSYGSGTPRSLLVRSDCLR